VSYVFSVSQAGLESYWFIADLYPLVPMQYYTTVLDAVSPSDAPSGAV